MVADHKIGVVRVPIDIVAQSGLGGAVTDHVELRELDLLARKYSMTEAIEAFHTEVGDDLDTIKPWSGNFLKRYKDQN